jgi:DNA-binding NarL/FixJ family response regulator
MITILIADDHPIFRRGLCSLFAESPDISIIAETGEGGRVLELVREKKPDVLLLDLNMPGTDGIDIAASIQREALQTKTIALTMHQEEEIFNKVMDLGVHGYVLKESATVEIHDAIKAVVASNYFVSPSLSKYLLRRRGQATSLLRQHPGLQTLTVAEKNILKLIAENKTSKEISQALSISIRTVDNHRFNICNKLDLHGTNALLRFALENKSSL